MGSISLCYSFLFYFATACYWRRPQSHALLAVGGCSDSNSSRQQLVAAQDVASAVMCTGPWVGFVAGLAQARFYPLPTLIVVTPFRQRKNKTNKRGFSKITWPTSTRTVTT